MEDWTLMYTYTYPVDNPIDQTFVENICLRNENKINNILIEFLDKFTNLKWK
jgi:hypothetical protein